MFRKTVLLIGLATIVSCASDLPSVKILAKYQESNPSANISNASYLIGPGDVLAIDVWKEPELSKAQILVRLDGYISLPLLHDIKAAGLSCTQLENYLSAKYKDYVEVLEVSVTLLQSAKKIFVLGEVGKAGAISLSRNMTILQAITAAGGPSIWADTDNVKLIRKINGVEKHFRVNYDSILSGEDVSQNILLQPDDTIFVP